MKSDEEELGFVIDHYRVPVPAAARRLLLQRARLAQERWRQRAQAPSGPNHRAPMRAPSEGFSQEPARGSPVR